MIAEIGLFLIITAWCIAVAQTACATIAAQKNNPNIYQSAQNAATIQTLTLASAFTILIILFVQSDFSVSLVYQHSATEKPILYKIAATWGNHQGSMLLWCLMIAAFTYVNARTSNTSQLKPNAYACAVMGALNTAFILFLITTSNPFERLENPPDFGRGLNPVLQDPALALHPPILYLGYIGLAIPFAHAISALILKDKYPNWTKIIQPWTLFAWSALTLGIALGSWWAYYELGWGGWWFWDPVENASLMPWLAATALIHSTAATQKRNVMPKWTLFLALITFSLSVTGTFLVRSGILTSVHSFAVDPAKGLFILIILAGFTGSALILYMNRARHIKINTIHALISRETTIAINNLIILCALATVLVGTLYPLALEAANGQKISVGPPYFERTFMPFVILTLFLAPIGQNISWITENHHNLYQNLIKITLATAISAGVIIIIQNSNNIPYTSITAFLLIIGAIWMIIGVGNDIRNKRKKNTLKQQPIRFWGMILAHLGVAMLVVAATTATIWKTEIAENIKIGQNIPIQNMKLHYIKDTLHQGPNYIEEKAEIRVIGEGGDEIAKIYPSRRFYQTEGQLTTEVALHHFPLAQLYVVIGEQNQNKRSIRAYHYPGISFIWIAALLIAGGGAIAMVGHAKVKKSHKQSQCNQPSYDAKM